MAISVLVVDDSAFMRRAITQMLEAEPDIRVCATARNGTDAIAKAAELHPDVITMDVEMPGSGGLEAVMQIVSRWDIPVIMVSSLTQDGAETTFLALDAGAVDFITKPDAAYANIREVARDLVAKVRAVARSAAPGRPARVADARPRRSAPPDGFAALVMGASTGGPVALSHILRAMPAAFPLPIVIVQHMPRGFTRPLAERLNAIARIRVVEGKDGFRLEPGVAVIAPAAVQLTLEREGNEPASIRLAAADVHGAHVPSVDAMLASAARAFGSGTLAAILTGMGRDGVSGLRSVKGSGGYVLAQDEASCVVYGMPRAAAEAGLVDRVVALEAFVPALCELTGP
jgi:two-component system chemotaxis response regulator CheB